MRNHHTPADRAPAQPARPLHKGIFRVRNRCASRTPGNPTSALPHKAPCTARRCSTSVRYQQRIQSCRTQTGGLGRMFEQGHSANELLRRLTCSQSPAPAHMLRHGVPAHRAVPAIPSTLAPVGLRARVYVISAVHIRAHTRNRQPNATANSRSGITSCCSNPSGAASKLPVRAMTRISAPGRRAMRFTAALLSPCPCAAIHSPQAASRRAQSRRARRALPTLPLPVPATTRRCGRRRRA